MTLENNRAPLLFYIKLCASFQSHGWIQTRVTVRKRSIRVKIDNFLSHVTLKFDTWPWKTIGHLFYVASSFVHCVIAVSEFKLELQSGNSQFGSKSMFSCPVWPFEIWQMTLKNNRAHLLRNIKLCASFRHHMWIQTGVAVRKRLSWVLTSMTLTVDLWPCPFARTSLLSLVITHENFMMIWWWEHSQNGVTDRRTGGRTERRTEPFIELLGRS